MFPTLPTLLRIATVLDVGLQHFFVADTSRGRVAVIRKNDRVRLSEAPDPAPPAYLFQALQLPIVGRRIDAFYAEFKAEGPVVKLHGQKPS